MAVEERIYLPAESTRPGAAQPQASADAFGAPIGRGIAQLGGELHQARVQSIRAERQREEDSANAAAAAGAADLSLEMRKASRDAREQAPLDGGGHVDRVTAEADDRINKFLETIPDQRVRERWSARTREIRDNIIDDEDGWARGRRVEAFGTNVREAGRLWDNQLQGDPDPHALDQALKAGDDLLDGSDAPADIKDKLRREWQADRSANYLEGLIEKNPLAAQTVIKSGTLDTWLDAKDKRQLLDKSDAAVHAAALAAERELRARQAQARDYLTVLGKRFADGDPSISADELGKAQQLATELGDEGKAYDVAKWRTWKTLDDAYKGASSLQLSEASRALDAKIEKAGDKASPNDVIRSDRLHTLLDHRRSQEHDDPLGTVATEPVVPGDAGSIQKRVSSANAARRETGRYAFFTPEEVTPLREAIASGPDGKLQVIGFLSQIAGVDGQAALRAAEQIDPQDRTLRHALRVAQPVREMIVRGTAARATLPKSVIGPDGKGASLDTLTQSWFAENIAPALINSRPEFADDVLETARAIYSDWRRRSNSAGQDEEFNGDQFRRSVGLALGGMNGRGGVGDWQYGPRRSSGRAFPFVLPSRMTEDEAERRFGNPLIVAGNRHAPPGAVNGTPVWASGKPMSQYELTRKFVPVAIADGIYQFRAGNQVVHTADGHVFQADIRRLDPTHSEVARHSSQASRIAPIAPDYSLPKPKVRGPEYRQ